MLFNKILYLLLILTTILILKSIIDTNNLKKSWNKFLGNNNLLISRNYYKNYYSCFMRNFGRINSSSKYINLFNNFKITNKDEFLDIGSGLGLMCFGIRKKFNFNKIYGIELDKLTYNISIKNLKIMKMDKIELINDSIFNYEIPKTVSFIYLFNPFHNNIKLFEKIINKCKVIKNITIIWMNIKRNNIINKILNKSKIKKLYEGWYENPYLIFKF